MKKTTGKAKPTPPPAAKLPKITLVASQTVMPKKWPASRSATFGMLAEAISFVADGKPVTPEFLRQLKRMLASLEERNEIVQTVFDHHQMHRLQKLYNAIEQVEAVVFNPGQLALYEPDQHLKLLQLLCAEAASITRHLNSRDMSVSADNVGAAADPEKLKNLEETKSMATALPLPVRRALRESLQKHLAKLESDARMLADVASTPTK